MIFLLEIVLFHIRVFNRTKWDNNFWLDLDYLHVAKAAMNCSAYFSALLYAEIWCEVKR